MLNDSLYMHGIDEKNRRIYFGDGGASSDDHGDVSVASVNKAVIAIQKMATDNPKKPIEIHMTSPGGDPYALLYLMDVILSTPCQIKFYGGGQISSSATWVMAVCDQRFLYKHTRLCIHNGSDTFEGSVTDLKIKMREVLGHQTSLEKIYAENSRMPEKFWADVCKRDLWITADECLTLGLCDKIVEPLKRGNLRQARQKALNTKVNKNKLNKLVKTLFERIELPIIAQEIVIHTPQDEIDATLVVENQETLPQESPTVEIPQAQQIEGDNGNKTE
jgi:ATP-dependent Clp protease protease subunit